MTENTVELQLSQGKVLIVRQLCNIFGDNVDASY